MIKVYGVHGRTTALVRVPAGAGRAWIEVEFKRGRLGVGKANTAATYSTADPTEQAIIEDSPLFGSLIKLLRVYGEEGKPVAAPLATEKPDGAEVVKNEVPEVTTKEEAIAYLKAKGAKAVQLRSNEGIRSCADQLGIIFPNLNI